MKKRALGKGLRSLIPQAPPRAPRPDTETPAGTLREGLRQIDLDLIQPNPRQPREKIDDATLEELALSLTQQGVLQPVMVRPAGEGRFELVAGERRWRAAQLAGLLKIPALVRQVPDDRILEFALVENLQREQLNAIEEAQAYEALSRDFKMTQQQIAERTGKQKTTVANAMRLLNLPGAVQEKVKAGKLTAGHARTLLGLEQPLQQIEAADRVVREGLSVRDTERLVAKLAKATPGKAGRPRTVARDPNLVAAEESLQRELGTKVRIVQGKSGGGRIELHCFSGEELERVYELIIQAARRKPHSTPS